MSSVEFRIMLLTALHRTTGKRSVVGVRNGSTGAGQVKTENILVDSRRPKAGADILQLVAPDRPLAALERPSTLRQLFSQLVSPQLTICSLRPMAVYEQFDSVDCATTRAAFRRASLASPVVRQIHYQETLLATDHG